MVNLRPPCLDAGRGVSEERAELYVKYCKGAQWHVALDCGKNDNSAEGFGGRQTVATGRL